MYDNKFVVAIKNNGKILRENNNDVALPFGSEFSILIKNLNSVKAKFRISIDGTDATENVWLIVNPNSSVEVERFIKAGNLNKGNKFKFIEKTSVIEEFRGSKIDDGLVRVEFQFEQPITTCYPIWNNGYVFINSINDGTFYGTVTNGSIVGNTSYNSQTVTYPATVMMPSSTMTTASTTNGEFTKSLNTNTTTNVNLSGITVPGSESSQQFIQTYGFTTDGITHAIVLKLIGVANNGEVFVKPVTVQTKPICTTCGLQNKVTHNFCSQCGTALQLF